eukprot:7367895-Pyramimonas_sp.AAC.1
MRATTSRRMGPFVLDIPHHTRCRMHTHVGRLGIGDVCVVFPLFLLLVAFTEDTQPTTSQNSR